MKFVHLLAAALAMVVAGCAESAPVGTRTDALDANAWERSEWISAVDAPAICGTIRSAWKYEGDACTWTFTIPEGASASVTLPGENETRTYGPGSCTLSF